MKNPTVAEGYVAEITRLQKQLEETTKAASVYIQVLEMNGAPESKHIARTRWQEFKKKVRF